MKFRTIGFLIFGTIILLVIWFNLPPTVNRIRDIKLGNRIIKKIDEFKITKELPDRHDWETLRQFGFEIDGDVWTPQYEKINDDTYELVFVEGFDGPYLLWNSKERKWKIETPTIPDDYIK